MNRNVFAAAILLNLFSCCFSMENSIPNNSSPQNFSSSPGILFRYHVTNILDITKKVLDIDNDVRENCKLSEHDKDTLINSFNDCIRYLRIKNPNESYKEVQTNSYIFTLLCERNNEIWTFLYASKMISQDNYYKYVKSFLALRDHTFLLIENDNPTKFKANL